METKIKAGSPHITTNDGAEDGKELKPTESFSRFMSKAAMRDNIADIIRNSPGSPLSKDDVNLIANRIMKYFENGKTENERCPKYKPDCVFHHIHQPMAPLDKCADCNPHKEH